MGKEFNGIKKSENPVVGESKSGRKIINKKPSVSATLAFEKSADRRAKADEKAEWRKLGKL